MRLGGEWEVSNVISPSVKPYEPVTGINAGPCLNGNSSQTKPVTLELQYRSRKMRAEHGDKKKAAVDILDV